MAQPQELKKQEDEFRKVNASLQKELETVSKQASAERARRQKMQADSAQDISKMEAEIARLHAAITARKEKLAKDLEESDQELAKLETKKEEVCNTQLNAMAVVERARADKLNMLAGLAEPGPPPHRF